MEYGQEDKRMLALSKGLNQNSCWFAAYSNWRFSYRFRHRTRQSHEGDQSKGYAVGKALENWNGQEKIDIL